MEKIFKSYILPLVLAGAGILIPKEYLIANIVGYSLIIAAVVIFIVNLLKRKTSLSNFVFSSLHIRRKTDKEISEEAFNTEADLSEIKEQIAFYEGMAITSIADQRHKDKKLKELRKTEKHLKKKL